MSIDTDNISKVFAGLPDIKFRLRWEIWQNGVRSKWQSWSPSVVLKFSEERKKFKDNDDVYIVMQSLDGYIEQRMLKVKLRDVEKIEYHHLFSGRLGNIFSGIRVHTSKGIWNCCANGQVFEEAE